MRRSDAEPWESFFVSLTAYKNLYGDCEVPPGFKQRPDLAVWVAEQRRLASEGKLALSRRDRLKKLGLSLPRVERNSPSPIQREEVTEDDATAEPPASATTREERAEGGLPDSSGRTRPRKRRSVGTWEDLLAQLAEFRRRYGHAEPTVRLNPLLTLWLKKQKQAARAGRLDAERRAHLEALGVVLPTSRAK